MIHYFLYPLHEVDALGFLNVLRYTPVRALLATLTALVLSFGYYPRLIALLQKQKLGQVIRSDGPESHFSKAGTPTMGGSLILIALVISTLLWADLRSTMMWLILAITLLYGLIGLVDDARKIWYKNSKGLSARQKLGLQFGIAFLACGYLWYGEASLGVPEDWILVRDRLSLPFVPFTKAHALVLPKPLYVCFASFVLVAMSNAVNLTDGLDGLAIGPVMINAGVYMVIAYVSSVVLFKQDLAAYLHVPSLRCVSELTVFCGALMGAGFGFLWYNTYPAQIFMGDVGSLALGASVGMLAILTKNEFLSILVGGVFFIEAVSVIGQVISFRLFKKRIFLMAPIHHHFEKKGWPEPRVIVRFWIISIFLGLASLLSLKLR